MKTKNFKVKVAVSGLSTLEILFTIHAQNLSAAKRMAENYAGKNFVKIIEAKKIL